jgi:hypothetical protein
MMKQILFAAVLFLCVGCAKKTPAQQWDVELVSPSGVVTQKWTIDCHGQPYKLTNWGGQIRLRDVNNSKTHDWEQDIVAPAGWSLRVTPHVQPPKAKPKGRVDL